MSETLKESNAAMRVAVAEAQAAKALRDAEPAIPVDYILQAEAELKRERQIVPPVSGVDTAASRTLMQALDAVDARRGKYGPPAAHFSRTAAMVNAAFGTSFTASDWALIMILDKIARQRGPGPMSDNAVDIAGYAACHEEARR